MIRKKQLPTEFVIDLTGPDGNVFVLMGHAKKLAHQLGIDDGPIIEEMMNGDYEHLVRTFENNFGEYVILERFGGEVDAARRQIRMDFRRRGAGQK